MIRLLSIHVRKPSFLAIKENTRPFTKEEKEMVWQSIRTSSSIYIA